MEETTTENPLPITGHTSLILLLSKIGAMFLLGLGSLISGMLPLIVARYRMRKQDGRRGITSDSSTSTNASSSTVHIHSHSPQGLLTSLLLCFGGGVLLFTTFLHLAPEVRQSVERHQANGQLATLGSLSLAELLFCGGFFFVYLVEETVHAALTNKPESSETLLYRTVSVRRCNNNNNNNNNNQSGTSTTTPTATRSWKRTDCNENKNHNKERQQKILPPIYVLSSSSETSHHDNIKYDLESLKKSENRTDNSIRGLLTVLALSFHAIFEGLAVGLEPSLNSVVYLAAAIATHKLVIAFCVGMELYVARTSTKTILGYLSVFSMVTPFGIVAGMALGHFKNDSENLGPVPTILQGMAAGTLLYVVFFEVLARERANEKSGLLQLAAILVGFMLMLGLQLAMAHSHSHGHSHGEEHHEEHDEGKAPAIERVTDSIVNAVSKAL
ncbi:zinc transporter ZIP3-like isoform X1 [Leptopilina boulardi]|uniref:zinc transporter ZIP3-like isoform X1 n=1 Tax=Leptopilina boulardi TaxID=63433 RepID=UPI0021F56B27|nr:zinc transporter ZIP3-like isoform X1 [Leptopilina boulardi]XP_051165419.1 zinc transporter ZIP3-like isoform X1 [Leptopilina boulardi]